MIDIIIPTYNNKQGLLKTLNSIPQNKDLIVTIIDDCSTDDIDYSDIIQKYTLLQTPQNIGPGNTRQYGIDNTKEPYIMFIDTGDLFLNDIFNNIIFTIKKHSNINVFSWQHINEKSQKISNISSNHLHGKVYKREFLNKYNIRFCPESSYANEDIGFNRICRLLTKIRYIYTPIYLWTSDENSLTRKNNGEFNYKNQNIGLALNGIHIYNTCKNNISSQAMELECGELMGALYNNVICTSQEKSEFIQYAWQGARLFFKQIYQPNGYGINIALEKNFGRTLLEATKKKNKWLKPIPMNLKRFFIELDRYENPPEIYL